jgi:hypothetical protein
MNYYAIYRKKTMLGVLFLKNVLKYEAMEKFVVRFYSFVDWMIY